MGAPGGVLEAEARDVVPQLGERSGCGRAGQAGADHDDVEPQLVRRVDELDLGAMPFPLLRQRPRRDPRPQLHGQRTSPLRTATGMEMYPPAIRTAYAAETGHTRKLATTL